MTFARSPILAPDADLAGVVVTPLAIDAAHYWEAGTRGRASLDEGRTVAARDWTHELQGIALDRHPRVRALAQRRCDQLDAALTRHLSDEVA
ncbi:hypothetical protein [Methylobacterium frigidaeris]|uniref:Uncharacterized protein n=1 Tax=Methylobacterium frigidaeris TaxID=2038277 RepID=A0AA37HGL3_9HYPH|nr:hypothetical protein [Methylobacterium frigidaeris]PIK74588.1 hypothetical protein CS379_01690 [Methylobacterium frigidaeris]GJD65151.1 hypothetical protein MPEAHAMD_5338 [Methylobacterium frigidaeris]